MFICVQIVCTWLQKIYSSWLQIYSSWLKIYSSWLQIYFLWLKIYSSTRVEDSQLATVMPPATDLFLLKDFIPCLLLVLVQQSIMMMMVKDISVLNGVNLSFLCSWIFVPVLGEERVTEKWLQKRWCPLHWQVGYKRIALQIKCWTISQSIL